MFEEFSNFLKDPSTVSYSVFLLPLSFAFPSEFISFVTSTKFSNTIFFTTCVRDSKRLLCRRFF